jgi:hypothetical protein
MFIVVSLRRLKGTCTRWRPPPYGATSLFPVSKFLGNERRPAFGFASCLGSARAGLRLWAGMHACRSDACRVLSAELYGSDSMGRRELRKKIQTLEQRVEEHATKIAAERARSEPDEGRIRHLEREIRAFHDGIARARKRLGERL